MAIITGTSGNDTRIGTAADDTIDGAGGNDLLFGTGGRDYLYAGLGNDTAWGGDERDWLYGGNGRDSLFGDALGDRLDGGNGDDRLAGGTGMDTAWGGAGNDQLWGGTGNDTLSGGTGNDSLDGGAGIDRARYAGPQDGYRLHLNPDGTVTVTDLDTTNGDMGTDRLRGIEGIDFADGSATLALDDRLVTDEDAGRGGNAAFTFTAADLLANDLGDGLRLTAIDTSGLEGHLTWSTDGDGFITDLAYTPTPDSVPSFVWIGDERVWTMPTPGTSIRSGAASRPDAQHRLHLHRRRCQRPRGHRHRRPRRHRRQRPADGSVRTLFWRPWGGVTLPLSFYAVDVDSDVFAVGIASTLRMGSCIVQNGSVWHQ
ncbi:MAG: calcium-binding protein [Geminicoccaceae bacterium]